MTTSTLEPDVSALPRREELADFYETYAPELLYTHTVNRKTLCVDEPAFECRVSATLALLGSPRSGTLVDIGCGSGILLCRAAKRGRWDRIVTCDISQQHLNHAKELCAAHNLSRIEFQRGDITEWLPEATDATHVMCTEVLEHLLDPKTVLKRIAQIGSDRTQFIFSVPYGEETRPNLVRFAFSRNGDQLNFNQEYLSAADAPSRAEDASDIVHWQYRPEEFTSLLAECGFEITARRATYYLGTFRNPLAHLLWKGSLLPHRLRHQLRDQVADHLWWNRTDIRRQLWPDSMVFKCKKR